MTGFPDGEADEGPPPLPQRDAGSTLDAADRAELIALREAGRVARENKEN